MLNSNTKKNVIRYLALYVALIPLVAVVILSFNKYPHQQFSALAASFLSGKLYFPNSQAMSYDSAFYQGKYFWPLGPFPAVLLFPFIALFNAAGLQFYESYLHEILFLSAFTLIILLARILRYSKVSSFFWAYAFCFGSALFDIALTPMSWQFAQLVAVNLLLLSLYAYYKKASPLITGTLLGLTLATRITAGLGIIFFILLIMFKKLPAKAKLREISLLLAPFMLVLVLLFFYNFARFGNYLEQGYSYQILFIPELAKAREYGVFSIKHLPGNIYYLLLAGPQAVFAQNSPPVLKFPFIRHDYWGIGVFFTSPYLIYLLFMKFKDQLSRFLWITVIIILVPILFYYGVGFMQFGYRYALDFFPFLFLLLMHNYKKEFGEQSKRLRILIIISIIFNFYLLFFSRIG